MGAGTNVFRMSEDESNRAADGIAVEGVRKSVPRRRGADSELVSEWIARIRLLLEEYTRHVGSEERAFDMEYSLDFGHLMRSETPQDSARPRLDKLFTLGE